MSDRLRITVTDVMTGEKLDEVIYDDINIKITPDYFLVTTGTCCLSNTQAHANGTHVLTVKGCKSRPNNA